MKKILIFLFLSIVPQVLKAEKEPGLEYFNHIMYLYESGQYENAKMGFSYCIEKFSAVVSIDNCKNYINICDQQLERERHKQQKIREAKEKAAKAEREAFLQKERDRIKNKLVYISTDATNFNGQFNNFSDLIISKLKDSGYQFTDNPDNALWCVYIIAITSKRFPNISNDENHLVDVDAYYKVIYELEPHNPKITTGHGAADEGSRISYDDAANKAYYCLCNNLCEKIKNDIK